MKLLHKEYRQIWQLSLGSFILAALIGFLYRMGMIYPLSDSLDLVNIRHAHSHLMFFNWVSPLIMAWMVTVLSRNSGRKINHAPYKACLYTMVSLGFLSYPFFLLHGYSSIPVGSADLPVAAMISGLIMFTWYWFAWFYYNDRKQSKDPFPVSLSIFDGALTALLISSLGAWGVSIFQFGGMHNPLYSSALTHFFLAVFTEGWAVMGIFGIVWSQLSIQDPSVNSGWLWQPILLGSMLIFPLGLTESLVTPLMLYSAKAGLILIVISLSLHFYFFAASIQFIGFVWRSVLGLIGLKILFQSFAILLFDFWLGEHNLHILYLHILLLGIVSISLIQVYHSKTQQLPVKLFTGSVLLILISLFSISGYGPSWLLPSQPYLWVMFFAFLPIIPAGWILLKSFTVE